MTQNPGMDWPRHNRLLDRVGYSIYSDLDHYDWTVERLDAMRSQKPVPYWLLETAPNWSGGGRQWNIHHIWRDIITDDADISRYKVLLLPLLPIVHGKLRDQLGLWLRNGGHLLLGPLTGYRTEEWTTPRDRELAGLEDLIGAEVALRFSAMWIENQINVDFGDGATVRPIGFCDGYAPGTAKTLATYRGGYGNGTVAVLENQVGKGKVIVLGCRTEAGTYYRLVKRLLDDTGIRLLAEGGDGKVIVAPRGKTGLGIVNITEQPRVITLPRPGKDRITGRNVERRTELSPLEVLALG